MAKIIDCFLFHNEIELLEIRLEYLAGTADRFVIVTSSQTFTGHSKQRLLLESNSTVVKFLNRIDFVYLDTLIGNGAWEREAYSRNAISRGLTNCQSDDLIVISDVDELPRKSVLRAIRNGDRDPEPTVLGLDYFNFKFNYKQIYGRQAIWPGPVVCRFDNFTSAQEMRSGRWDMFEADRRCIEDAGWHFSFLTSIDGLSDKLMSFSHQEPKVQTRGDESIAGLIERREGFHDHLHAGSVWAIVDLDSLGCPDLVSHVQRYRQYLVPEPADTDDVIKRRIRRSEHRRYNLERMRVLSDVGTREIVDEVLRRLKRKLS